MKNSVDECAFKPEIKRINKKLITNLKIESNKILENADSYVNYSRKSKKCRENQKNKNNNMKYEYPITKHWKSPHKNRVIKYNNYDYTRHELT